MHRFLRAAAVLAVGLSGLLTATAPAHASVHATHAAGAAVPADPDQRGFLALCGPADQTITGGSTTTAPFVWKIVSSQPPAAAFTAPGRNAVVSIYQERPGVDPGDWSGTQLVADTRYDDPALPTAMATRVDLALSDIEGEYPPMGPGYYQLRMGYGRIGYGVDDSGTYAATTIQVTGASWHVVSGGTLDCAKATGESSEVYAGAAPAAPTAAYVAQVASAQQAAGSPSTPPSATETADADQVPTTTTAAAGHGSGGSGGSDATVVGLAVALVAVVLIGGGAFAAQHRRRGGRT